MATRYTSPKDFYDDVGAIAAGPAGDDANQIALVIAETDIKMGMLCSQNSTGKAIKGLDSVTCMPLWSLTVNDESTADYWSSGAYADSAQGDQIGIGDKANFVAGNGGIEIFTNQYVSGETYTAGRTILTASSGASAGKVEPAGTYYSDAAVVGVVSRGLQTDKQNMSNRQVLYLWPVYMPPVKSAVLS